MNKRGYISPKVRGFIFALDLCQCRYCGKWQTPWTQPTPHIDHFIPISQNGGDNITNYTLSCQDCNLRKGTKTWPAQPRGIINYIVAAVYLMATAVISQKRMR